MSRKADILLKNIFQNSKNSKGRGITEIVETLSKYFYLFAWNVAIDVAIYMDKTLLIKEGVALKKTV